MPLDRRWRIIAYVCTAAFLISLIVRTAWTCDDAYITARTIDNWLHGYGLRWNVVERVQTFTHPLWLFLVAAAWRVTGEPYWSAMAVSILCASGAAILATTIDGASLLGAAALFFLGSSKAFVDFATSGLETPLTYLLLAAFLLTYWRARASDRWVLQTTVLAALAALNRLDTLVLLVPALVHITVVARPRATLQILLGLSPLIVWELFSVVYYGFLVPNTAYAKLATGIAPSELTTQGMAYLANSWTMDPPTLIAIGAAVIAGLWARRIESLTVAAGLLLHLVYVVRVGGDFMSGRFLAPAVIVSAALLLHQARTRLVRTTVAIMMVAIGALAFPHAVSRAWHPGTPPPLDSLIDAHGISDERLIYTRDTGLLKAIRRRSAPVPGWQLAGRQAAAAGVSVMSRDSVGFFGYGAGPSVQIVDTLALCDPLLARLPADRPWRIGHFRRSIPAGYMETLRGRRDHLYDPALDEYYAGLREITRGPLWSRARWTAIVALNTSRIRAPAQGPTQ